MASTLTWLDYSERDRRRALDVIDLFRETGRSTSLAGGVRNSFSELFFPGTSTIPRGCTVLLLPWPVLRLERLRVVGAWLERGPGCGGQPQTSAAEG